MINTPLKTQPNKPKPQPKKLPDAPINTTLQGVLLNNKIRPAAVLGGVDFNETCDALFISSPSVSKSDLPYLPQGSHRSEKKAIKNDPVTGFDVKKALVPLAIGTAAAFVGVAALSAILLKSSKTILKTNYFEQLPDLALNMNIREEPHFVTYRALRDPSFKNIVGAAALFVFSGLTLTAKNFTDGVKDVWVKKREADIERDLEENLIATETKSFSGKLGVINELLKENVKYFKCVLNNENCPPKTDIAFKGVKNSEAEAEPPLKKKPDILPMILGGLVVVATCAFAGKIAIKNIRKALESANEYTNKCASSVIDAVEKVAKTDMGDALGKEGKLVDLFSTIHARPESIRKTLTESGFGNEQVEKIVEKVTQNTKTIFADAPTALGGVPQKIQYYCYIDENRGHLYNWVINPKNKFTKYIFMAFSAVSAVGYVFKQGLDALKCVAVARENSKTELGLKQRLVDVEIENFTSKKNAAITPLIDNFNYQMKQGRHSEDLKHLAENILFEIKGGPPYVYS